MARGVDFFVEEKIESGRSTFEEGEKERIDDAGGGDHERDGRSCHYEDDTKDRTA